MGGIFSTHAETRTTSNILVSFSQAQIAANYSNASAKLEHAGVNWTDLDHDGKNWNSVVNTVINICDQYNAGILLTSDRIKYLIITVVAFPFNANIFFFCFCFNELFFFDYV